MEECRKSVPFVNFLCILKQAVPLSINVGFIFVYKRFIKAHRAVRENQLVMSTKVNVILSYYEDEQEFFDIEIDMLLEALTENRFLEEVFKDLSVEKLAQLLKISSCFDASCKEIPEFISATNGKFYFNVEKNADAETVKHTIMKLHALERLMSMSCGENQS